MNTFGQILEELQTGKQDLQGVEEWISAQLTAGKVDADSLLKTLYALPDLDADTVRSLAKHIESTDKQYKQDNDTYSGVDISHLQLAPLDEPDNKKEVDKEVSEAKTEFQSTGETGKGGTGNDNSLENTIVTRTRKQPATDAQDNNAPGNNGHGNNDPSEDETLIADDAPTAYPGTGTHASESTTHPSNITGNTGASWPNQSGVPTQIGPGTILKERFELITAIGEGGMGTVYKARDLLKVEAKDRNPFIAVKLLSGDFKQHPEAFISLQRETSKAQKLAHPNVATVYDFDRDGATVFMTMELLEGQELAKFIRKLPPGGLPAEEALSHIKQLCDGLAYAHDSGLVHSDLKPGNAYLTREKSLKLLDFGIARASKTRMDASGEVTLFDPSQLGALTPAYATIEMFEGSEPDPRDDIYALACISYELLSGKHPFNKLSAVKVKEKGLTPAPIPKLTKRQNRALREALNIDRNERTASVDVFWEGLRPRKDYTWYYLGGSVAAFVLIGLISYAIVMPWLERQQYLETIATVNQQGGTAVVELLENLDSYDPAARNLILEGIKDAAITYYEQHAESLVDPARQSWRYPEALALIEKLQQYYPDSAQVINIKQNLAARRDLLIAEQSALFNQYLEQQRILPIADESDITDVITILSQADPDNPLLNDARLATQYANLAREAIAADNYQRAAHIMETGLSYAPQDPALANLNDTVRNELQRRAEASEVAQIKQQLKAAQSTLVSTQDYIALEDKLLRLALLRPDDPLLKKLQSELQASLNQSFAKAIKNQQWQQAQQLLFTVAPLLPIKSLLTKRQALSRAQLESGYLPESLSKRNTRIAAQRKIVDALVAKPAFTPAWNSALAAELRKLMALMQPGHSWLGPLRENIATIYIQHADSLLKSGRYSAAYAALDQASVYAPEFSAIAKAYDRITVAKSAYEKAEERRLRQARQTALENQIRVQAQSGAINDAENSLAQLRKIVSGDNAFVTETAPKLLAAAYLELASAQARDGNYSNARTLAKRGLTYAPQDSALQQAFDEFDRQAKRAAFFNAVQNATPLTINELPGQLKQIQDQFPSDASSLKAEFITALAQRVIDLKDYDLVMANALLEKAQQLFPKQQTLQGIDLPRPATPSKYVAQGRRALQAGNLSAAEKLLNTAREKETGHPQISVFSQEVAAAQAQANKYFLAYQQYLQAGNRNQARIYLEAALQQWKDSELFQKEYNNHFTTTRAPERAADGSRPCTPALAGYGASGRAECYNMVAGQAGPVLVVIPAGDGIEAPYAIGKYEVSIANYNHYCRQTGCKELPGDGDLPATGLTVEQAKAYAAWLSEMTGFTYRLPTAAAWLHAAQAENKSNSSNFNCRVTQGGQILKGLSLLNVRTGQENAWGLTNYVGNAQEWVRSPNGLRARGGHFQDNLSGCSPALTRPHDGSADPLTGFRLLREIGSGQ